MVRPIFFDGPGVTKIGSIAISPTTPYFSIVGFGSPVENERLEKVGRTTGWTWGHAGATCEIQYLNPVGCANRRKLLCQCYADYGANAGDSGAPVFRWNTSLGTAVLVGTHWGRLKLSFGIPIDGIFSKITQIENDLGFLSLP